MKISLKTILITVGIIIISIIVYASIPDDRADNEENPSMNFDKLDDVVFNVKATPVIQNDLVLYSNAAGLLRAYKELDVTANISGIIREVKTYEGKRVKEGELLVKLDDREHLLNLDDAEVRVTDARVEYGFLMQDTPISTKDSLKAIEIEKQIEKLNKDYNEGKISETKYNLLKDELDMKLIFTGAKREQVILNKSGLTAAINNYKKAKLNLNYTSIKASFDGSIADIDLVAGQRVNAGEVLCKLVDTKKLKADLGILESDIVNIKVGNTALVKLNVAPEKVHKGKVTFISPIIDPETNTCKVTIELENNDNSIKPGMFINVRIESQRLPQRMLIPKEALLVRDRRNLVFVEEDGLAKWKYVDIGEQNDEFIEVFKGIEIGDKVIYDGHFTLAHDAKVKIIK